MRMIALAAGVFLLAASTGWGSAGPKPALHAKTHWRATVAKLPANAATGKKQAVSIGAISCASPGNCTAVGSYNAVTGDDQEGLLLTEKAGHWGRGVEAVLPANAAPEPSVNLGPVSCASAGNCTAVGTYLATSGGIYGAGTRGLLLTERAGHWTAGVEAVLPAGSGFEPVVTLTSVSCTSPGNCVAGGYDEYPEGLLFTEKAGHWAPGVNVGVGPAEILSVSCSSDGGCSAVGADKMGEYRGGSQFGDPLLLTRKRGMWHEVGVEVGGGLGESAVLNSISCSSAGHCIAVGLDNVGIDQEYVTSFLLTEKAGRWRGVHAKPPKIERAKGDLDLGAVSCASPGNCVAWGNYVTYDSTGSSNHLTLVTEKAGKWRRAVEAPLARRVQRDGLAVSCVSPGNCTAVGHVHTKTGFHGRLFTEIAGSWARGIKTPLPTAFALAVSCASPGNCGATANDYHGHGILLDSSTKR